MAETVSNDPEKKPWLIKPGEVRNPNGRPKGSRNKLGEAFTDALYADFQQNGIEAIVRVRNEEPAAYVRVIAGLLPKEMKVETTNLAEMSDDELGRLIDIIRTADGAALEARGGISPQASTH